MMGKYKGKTDPTEIIASTESKVSKTAYSSHSSSLVLTIPKKTKLLSINDRPVAVPSKKESVVTLARKGHITQKKFRKYNELKSFEAIVPGMPYYFKSKKSKAKVPYHTVQAGESIWSIAQKYGVKQWSLRNKNRMARTGSTTSR